MKPWYVEARPHPYCDVCGAPLGDVAERLEVEIEGYEPIVVVGHWRCLDSLPFVVDGE
jgi:hypothetical protein